MQNALAVRSLKKGYIKINCRNRKEIWRLRNGRTVFAPTYFPIKSLSLECCKKRLYFI